MEDTSSKAASDPAKEENEEQKEDEKSGKDEVEFEGDGMSKSRSQEGHLLKGRVALMPR
jgi:hypothetical protein